MPLSLGLLGGVLLGALQLLLCVKTKRKAIQCIPLYIVACGLLLGIATFMGLFGSYSVGAISGNELVGFILVSIVGFAGVGVLIAWLIYGLILLIGRK